MLLPSKLRTKSGFILETCSPNLLMVSPSESFWVWRTSFSPLSVLPLMIRIGSRIGLGAPVLLTDRSEKEKRSSLGGSSLAIGRGWSIAVSVSWTLNSFGFIVEAEVSTSYHWQGLISQSYWYLIARRSFSS